jgi:acyl-CoA thioester hydrolase
MDAFGHVNNTVYFRYMETARMEWLEALSDEYVGQSAPDGPVIVNACCEFLLPLTYPADLEVRMFLGDPGRTSIGSYFEIWSEGRKFAEGAARMVWINRKTQRSTPLPPLVAGHRAGDGNAD